MTKSKKLGDLSIKKPSSQAEESVKGGALKAGLARRTSKKRAGRGFARTSIRSTAE